MIKFISLIFIFISSFAMADDFRVTPGFESFSLKSKDKDNQGDIELYSSFNPNLKFQYNKPLSKTTKLSVIYKLQYVNFGNTIDKSNTILNNFFVGQNFFTKTTNYFYYLGAQERYFLSSENSKIVVDKTILPVLNLGFNYSLFILDEHVVGLGARASYIYGGNKTLKNFQVQDGVELIGGLTFTRFYNKRFFYRVFIEYGYDSQNTSITENQTLKNSFGVDFNFKF